MTTRETFRPISVKPFSANPTVFALRCLIDLQLGTIVEHLRPAMPALPAGEILDVGAGEAPWREWLPDHCQYVGLDVQNADDFGMSRKSPDIHFYDGGVMPFTAGRFNGALCVEVLEHVEDPNFLLAEIARVLKPGGVLLLTVPWSARRHHIPYDFSRFSPERLGQLLAANGFAEIEVRERGNDVAAIANKMIVLTVGCLKRLTLLNAVLLLPAFVLFAVISVIMLMAAHLSRWVPLGSDADPLGYFCRARRT